VIDALELTPEALGALELDERRRWDALAQLLELEALEHPVSRYDPAADGARLAPPASSRRVSPSPSACASSSTSSSSACHGPISPTSTRFTGPSRSGAG